MKKLDYADVNRLLKRPLDKGTQYDRYFKNSSCTPAYLGTNDTAFTVRQMVKWAEKNTGQTKPLALEKFSGFPLSVTVKKIYDFLYRHIQYELDGRDQNLKSPACAWATRATGTDCKSYSIFASTLLSNLGIRHYFRRVKQPNPYWPNEGIDPNKWSHVYIVVPKNQKTPKAERQGDYFVLDATTHDNKEVKFSLKADKLMSKVSLPHYGLQAPAVKGLGCSCQKGAHTPVMPRQNLHGLGFNSNGGIDLSGILSSTGQSGSTSGNTSGSSKAQTYTNIATGLISAGAQGAQQNRLATSQGSRDQRLDAIGKTGATSATIKSIGVAAAPYTYGITAILALVPSEWYEKVLGQWFKDGFKCTGSTWTETKAKQIFEIEYEYIQSEAFSVLYKFETGTISQIEDAINKWMEFFYSVRSVERDWLATSAKDCTRDGLILLVKSLDEAKKEFVSQFKSVIGRYGHNLAANGTKTVKYPAQKGTGRHALTQEVEQFTIQLNPSVVAQEQRAAAQSQQAPASSYGTPPINTTQNLQNYNATPQQAGFGTTGILALLALAGGAYLYNS